MKKKGAYAGQILRINLKDKSVKKEELDEKIARLYLGSKGLSAYYLFRELRKGVDPLSPENKIAFMTGPLTGTRAPVPNRFSVSTKSPLTGAWLDSHCGGFFGPELKFAGYDGIIIEGKAPEPVYIYINDDEVRILDAQLIWGADTFSTERILKEKHMRDRMPRVACIGPAGEKQALLANIISEVRAAGRGGAGAVMGSKNLKAIVVVGHKYGPDDFVYDKEKFMEAVRETSKLLSESKITGPRVRGALSIYGTANIIDGINAAGGWPTRNFQTGVFEKAEEVNGPSFGKEIWIPPDSPGARPCYACQILCAHAAVIRDGKYAGTFDEGPEYETIWAFGPQCGVSDKKAITRADYLSDYYGLDTISLGNTIGFLMECYERGLITKEDTDGIDLRFGNADALVEVVHRAGTLEGNIGKLAANGVKRAAEKIGKGSEKFAIHVKGLELPAYEPRAAQGMGLAYARSDRGACHLRPWTAGAEMLGLDGIDPRKTEGKAELVKTASEVFAVAYDSTGLCLFIAFGAPADKVYDMVNHATGFNYKTFDEFVKVGERIHNLTRAFNVREGFTRKDDTLPWRLLNEPLPEGPCKGDVVKLDEMLPEYYKLCGWDEEGRPTKEKLKELGLDFAIKELYGE